MDLTPTQVKKHWLPAGLPLQKQKEPRVTAKLAYLMRHGAEFDPAQMREIIYDLFAGSFENDCGAVDLITDSLSTAIFRYRCATEGELDVAKEFISDSKQSELYFCDCMSKILRKYGFCDDMLTDYAVWPDCLSVETHWEKEVLRELALIQAGHDLIVRDQLKRLWEDVHAKEAALVAGSNVSTGTPTTSA